MTARTDPIEHWVARDPGLTPFAYQLKARQAAVVRMARRLSDGHDDLAEFALRPSLLRAAPRRNRVGLARMGPQRHGHLPDRRDDRLAGKEPPLRLQRIDDNGAWELRLPADRLAHGISTACASTGREATATAFPPGPARGPGSEHLIFNAQVWAPGTSLPLAAPRFRDRSPTALYIYEAQWAWPRRPNGSAPTENSREQSCRESATPATTPCSSWPSRNTPTTPLSATRSPTSLPPPRVSAPPRSSRHWSTRAHGSGLR